MPLRARAVDRALRNKIGFDREERRHRVYLLRVGGVTVAQTLMSHGSRELDRNLVGRMARQLGLTSRQFRDLVNCPMTRQEFFALLGLADKS